MSSEIAYLQDEHEREITRIQQTLEEYIHGNPETTRFCFFLPSPQDIDKVKQAAAQASMRTGTPIDLIYPTGMTCEEQG